MKTRLPIIGEVRTGKDAEVGVQTVEVEKKSVSDTSVLGGFLDFFTKRLSSEKDISDKLIKAFEGWVYINVSTLAEAVSTMEFELFQFRMSKGQVELEPVEEHELLDLLNRFNDATTQSDAIYNTSAHLDLTGDCFWFLEGGKGGRKPDNIFLLQPDAISIKLGDFTDASARLIDGYHYKIIVDGNEVERDYDPDEIMHTKVPNPGNPYRGKSAVEAIATTLDTDNYAEQALLNLFKNGLIGDFFLSAEKRMTPEQLKNFAAQFRAAFTGVRNAWKVPILYGGVKPEKLMMTGREMQLIELEEWLRNKIMSAFKNTRASLGIDDEVNRSTSESSILNWKRSVIAPKMTRIVNSLNEYLVPRYGNNLVLGFKDPVPEDRDAEIKEATELMNAKIITKNEARKILGYEEVEGGDEFETIDPLKPLDPQVPKSLRRVNYKSVFRKANVFTQAKEFRDLKKKAMPIAKKMFEKKEEVREHGAFTNEQVWDFYNDVIKQVELIEVAFEKKVSQLLEDAYGTILANLPEELNERTAKKELLDETEEERKVLEAILILSPLLINIATASGGKAAKLVDSPVDFLIDETLQEFVEKNVKKFMKESLDTARADVVNAIVRGIEEGKSIPQIEKAIREKIPELSKVQTTRITRTEVIRTSNFAQVKAWRDSGLVRAKQWLTAMDDRVDPFCASLNGKIIDIDASYFKKGDEFTVNGKTMKLNYSSTPYPPLHVNCRCEPLPVLISQEGFDTRSYEVFQELQSRILEAEGKADKRTKEYKEWKSKFEVEEKSKAELEEYVKELEKIAGIGDEK